MTHTAHPMHVTGAHACAHATRPVCATTMLATGMGRWYSGVVRSYDPESDMHLIAYKDGDSLDHVLRVR